MDRRSTREKLEVKRSFKPEDFGSVVNVQLHTFTDASSIGYGTVIFVRLEDDTGRIAVSQCFAKARVVPLEGETIPRSELVAAALGAKLSSMLVKELKSYEDGKNIEKY